MRVLVTGAGGFVGGHTVRALAAEGHTVRALVRMHRPAPAAASPTAPQVEVVRGDVTDPASCDAAVAGCDAVVHVAGLIRARDEAGFTRVNVFGARVVAETALRAGVRRIVLVSSLAARGPADVGHPVSLYGKSKRAGEDAVREVARTATAVARGGGAERGARDEAMEVVVVRPTAVYGPGDEALLPLFQLATFGIRPVLPGAGHLTFVHAEDLARALARLADPARAVPSSPLEASDGARYTWDQVARTLGTAAGSPGASQRIPAGLFALAARAADLVARVSGVPQVFGRDKLADMRGDWSATAKPFWEAAGIAPRIALPEGLAATARAYRATGVLR